MRAFMVWLHTSFPGWLLRKQLSVFRSLFILLFRTGVIVANRPARITQAHRSAQEEANRQAGCRTVVLEYAEYLGFIAREAISRDELEKLIDGGIEPEDLSREIQSRIEKIPGIMLGHCAPPNGHVSIKLP